MSASVELLKAARAKIADPANWTSNTWARDKSGEPVMPQNPQACSWCARGAVEAVCDRDHGQVTSAERWLFWAADRRFGGQGVAEINDALGHSAVLRLFDFAIAEAESHGSI